MYCMSGWAWIALGTLCAIAGAFLNWVLMFFGTSDTSTRRSGDFDDEH